MSEIDNSKMLRAASFNLAVKICEQPMNIKEVAKLIEGLAKNYGNRRVARLKRRKP